MSQLAGHQTELGPFTDAVGVDDGPRGRAPSAPADLRARSVAAAIAGLRTHAPRSARGRVRPSPGGILIALSWVVSVLVLLR